MKKHESSLERRTDTMSVTIKVNMQKDTSRCRKGKPEQLKLDAWDKTAEQVALMAEGPPLDFCHSQHLLFYSV